MHHLHHHRESETREQIDMQSATTLGGGGADGGLRTGCVPAANRNNHSSSMSSQTQAPPPPFESHPSVRCFQCGCHQIVSNSGVHVDRKVAYREQSRAEHARTYSHINWRHPSTANSHQLRAHETHGHTHTHTGLDLTALNFGRTGGTGSCKTRLEERARSSAYCNSICNHACRRPNSWHYFPAHGHLYCACVRVRVCGSQR